MARGSFNTRYWNFISADDAEMRLTDRQKDRQLTSIRWPSCSKEEVKRFEENLKRTGYMGNHGYFVRTGTPLNYPYL